MDSNCLNVISSPGMGEFFVTTCKVDAWMLPKMKHQNELIPWHTSVQKFLHIHIGKQDIRQALWKRKPKQVDTDLCNKPSCL